MSFHFRPVSLIAAGIVALASGCAATEPVAPKGLVLNPPAPELPRKVATRPRPPTTVPAAAADETGLTQDQKDELFQRFEQSRSREAPL